MPRSNLNCTVQINDVTENSSVFFKLDGDRFAYPYTLKMLANSAFRFVVRFRPVGSHIKSIRVDGVDVLFKTDTEDANWVVEFMWCSFGQNKHKRNSRAIVPVEICFENYNFFVFNLQVKYYKKDSTHFNWGRKLTHVLVEALPTKPNVFQYEVHRVRMH